MPATVVRCSLPECPEVATEKAAAPWQDGSFAELKTYGYACPTHKEQVVARARTRPKASHLSPTETVGEIAAYPITR